jgi:protein gp37
MMGTTSIEWTDKSWPIINGCRRASEGCTNCYSERLTATRLSKTPKYRGLAVFKEGKGPRYTGETRLWVPHLDQPLRWKKPARVFVANMGDLFYERVTDDEIAAVFGIMASCPQHSFQLLTKRADRMRRWIEEFTRGGAASAPVRAALAARRYLKDDRINGCHGNEIAPWPLPNVWMGVSVENQEWADKRIPDLLATQAAIRFVSYEPALGPVNFEKRGWLGCFHESSAQQDDHSDCAPRLDWVIVGGESGPGARPFDVDWARSAIAQCKAAGVAVFYKQGGSSNRCAHSSKGGHLACFPSDLRVREFPPLAA